MTHEDIADAYTRYGHLVLRRCQRILRDDAAAEDVLQEVFVRLWRYGDAYRKADSKVSWLYRVAERCCFDCLARRRTRAEASLGDLELVASEGAARAVEERQIVMRFLERFDDRVKQVAVLHYLDGLTQEEIAQATGWSRQTVFKKLELLRERAAQFRTNLRAGGGQA